MVMKLALKVRSKYQRGFTVSLWPKWYWIECVNSIIFNKSDFAELRYKCYDWSNEDLVKIDLAGSSDEIQKRTCEGYENFVFTKGDDSKAPGCGNCWCCQPDNLGKAISVNKS